MHKRIFLLISMAAAFAAGTFAQTNYQFNASFSGDDALVRARRVENAAAAPAVNTAAAEHAAFEMINQKRIEHGLKPLIWSDEVAAIARLHSRNMASMGFFGHRGMDNKMVSDRADEAGLKRWRSIGENIAFERGYQDPTAKAVQLWLDSPSHRQNLMNSDWREAAVGVAVATDGSYYFTQVFLKR
jgi:uncharacterized protein YkwD